MESSKKHTMKSPQSSKFQPQDNDPLSSKTPEKPTAAPRRLRSRGTPLSILQIRKIAKALQNSDPPVKVSPDPILVGSGQTSTRRSKNPEGFTKLPEKYEKLVDLFDSMDSSIRLMRMKGTTASFSNLCPKIECLTDRRFTFGQLAQLKFILPEAIVLKKVLVLDELSSCMKPDLQVTLDVNAIEDDRKMKMKKGSANLHLRKVFRLRLSDFVKDHPQGDDVPEATLPEPFFSSKQKECINSIKQSNLLIPAESSNDIIPKQHPEAVTHLSQSFKKHFSKKFSKPSQPEQPNVSPQPLPLKLQSNQTASEKSLAFGSSPARPPRTRRSATPSKAIGMLNNGDVCSPIRGPSTKQASTPVTPTIATPSLPPRKRSFMSPEGDSFSSPEKLVRRSCRTGPLKFDTPVKKTKVEEEVSETGCSLIDSDIYDILPESLWQSIRENERKLLEEKDPAISQAKKRRDIISNLPKLFNMIHFFFQSISRSVVTKEELVHKVISSHCDIVDRREVEEQLELLLELVPEWITQKVASSGDLLFHINKASNPDQIRKTIAAAK